MKQVSIFILAILLSKTVIAQTDQGINDNWLFKKLNFSSQPFKTIQLPHTFNAFDADDGGQYYRGAALYQRHFSSPCTGNELLFIEFGSATLTAQVSLNGHLIGTHQGGYTRFRFLLSKDYLAAENELRVKVDNSPNKHIIPLGGDFSVFGGINQGVKLLCRKPLHFDLQDFGSDGVYIKSVITDNKKANIEVRSRINNSLANPINGELRLEIIDPDGNPVADTTMPMSLAENTTTEVLQTVVINNAQLWQGVVAPALYRAKLTIVSADNTIADAKAITFGVRTIEIDAEKGLFLNGKAYQAHGVNLHLSQRPGKGPAVSKQEQLADFHILDELGLTAIRLSHYPHPQEVYQYADKNGYLLWSEIPVIAEVDESKEFLANAITQLKEMIRQNYNHPSVFVWGLGNEVYRSDKLVNRIFEKLQSVAKQEDPERYTVYANCCVPVTQAIASHTDLNASNIYHGWYAQQKGDMSKWLDDAHAALKGRALAVSEYGAGGSVLQQEDPPQRPKTDSNWHPEQYQSLVHEQNWRAIKSKEYLWASFIWVVFDFASDGRNEGDRAGINDKGLVSYDRKTKKDAFYWYKANWSSAPVVYISSRRLAQRNIGYTPIKVYSNQARLQLYLNGQLISEQRVDEHIARWNVALRQGANHIKVASLDGMVNDTIVWFGINNKTEMMAPK